MNTQTLSALGQAALDYIAKGRRIIPIVPDGKTPMRKGWHENAITTAEEAFAHWSEHPDSNLAFCPEDEGLAIIENDPGGSVASLNLPATYEVQSPRGGTHYYYIGSVPPSASKLGPHIDTRGRTSYVLIPPSVVNGKKYKVKAARDYVALPADIETRLNVKPEVKKAEGDVPEDDPRNVAEAKRIIGRYKPAIEGQGGDNHTFQLCSRLVRDHNLSVDAALELLEPWNAKCAPPWEPEELRAKLEHARDYGQNEPGSGTPKPASEVFKDAQVGALVGAAATGSLLRPIPFAELAERKAKPVPELVPGLIERGIATMLSGPGGTHKSRLALQLGLALQAGTEIFGRPTTQCEFWYLDYENGADEIVRRAQKLRYGLKLPGLEGRYFDFKSPARATTEAIPDYEMAPALASVTDEAVTPGPLYHELFATLKATPDHKFVVLDSTYNVLRFTSQAKINEAAVKAALNLLDHLCAATDSTILYLWHPSRAGMERGDASGWSVAWENTPRARLSISKVEDAKDAFTLKVEKRNNGPTGEQITLHWRDGTLLPVADMADSGKVLLDTCVDLAVQAAEAGSPIQKQRKVSYAQLAHLERIVGFRPTDRDVKDQLAQALLLKRLRYVKGWGKNVAGYYPYEVEPTNCTADYGENMQRDRRNARLAKAKDQASIVPEDMAEGEPATLPSDSEED